MPPAYGQWNTALIEYATHAVRKGTPIYLAIDEGALAVVWRHFLRESGGTETARAAFVEAVTDRCGSPFTPDRLAALCARNASGRPCGVAFLAAMVLAAHDMEDDEKVTDSNYYYRFRRVFDPLSESRGRPNWLSNNGDPTDERLWEVWNDWLCYGGWESTAAGGEGGQKYVGYPICQAVLRKGDRVRLADLFRARESNGLDRAWDRDTLAAHLPALAEHVDSQRLKKLLTGEDDDTRRYEAVADAAYSVYRSLDWSGGEAEDLHTLDAGLFRTEDRRGNVAYSPYPRTAQRWKAADDLFVQLPDGGSAPLTPDPHRADRYLPLDYALDTLAARRFPVVSQPPGSELELALPKRDFWILVSDPDDDYSDALATWGLPALGEPFLLLCHGRHHEQLLELRALDLLTWAGHPIPCELDNEWREYHGCQVLRPRWEHVVPRPTSRPLVQAITPRPERVTVSLADGLSVPGRSAWLAGHPPRLTVRAAGKSFGWAIRRLNGGPAVESGSGATHTPVSLPDLPAGSYKAEVVTAEGVRAGRVFDVAAWDDQTAVAPASCYQVELPHFTLRGGYLLPEDHA